MSSLNLLDCLVLCINDLSTFKLFVLYDTKKKIYELRGKNYNLLSDNLESDDLGSENDSYTDSSSEQEEKDIDFVPFSFKSKKRKHLMEFIEYMVAVNSCEFTIYNYNNFPLSSNKITYDFLDKYQESKNEIFCYERDSFDKDMCKKFLKMIKNIYKPKHMRIKVGDLFY